MLSACAWKIANKNSTHVAKYAPTTTRRLVAIVRSIRLVVSATLTIPDVVVPNINTYISNTMENVVKCPWGHNFKKNIFILLRIDEFFFLLIRMMIIIVLWSRCARKQICLISQDACEIGSLTLCAISPIVRSSRIIFWRCNARLRQIWLYVGQTQRFGSGAILTVVLTIDRYPDTSSFLFEHHWWHSNIVSLRFWTLVMSTMITRSHSRSGANVCSSMR